MNDGAIQDEDTMDWIADFYARQNRWSGVYSGDVDDGHRERVAAIARYAGEARRVLELGAGGGQNAAAAADAGHDVVAVELVPESVAHAQLLARQTRAGSLTIYQGDFYTIDPAGPFDVICYWDGFGVGADADQRRLLRRIVSWLAPGGHVLLDISTPWYWAHAAGQEMRFGQAMRRYDFDADSCTMLDTWWPVDDPSQAVTQYIRCYSPADLRLLLEGSGLALDGVEPAGAVDYAQGTYRAKAPLHEAMQYLAHLIAV
jgi:SAM-dependent methyltransferase